MIFDDDSEVRVKHVYLETTIASYLASRPSRDLVIAARQELTGEWWEERRQDYALYVSQVVIDEAGEGDPDAARKRLAYLDSIALLETTDAAIALAEELLREGAVPKNAADDALHIAIATAHGMDILLTWNCRHIANADTLGAVGRLIRKSGYESPVICTPDELTGGPP